MNHQLNLIHNRKIMNKNPSYPLKGKTRHSLVYAIALLIMIQFYCSQVITVWSPPLGGRGGVNNYIETSERVDQLTR